MHNPVTTKENGIRQGWTIERTQRWVREMGEHPLVVLAEIIILDLVS